MNQKMKQYIHTGSHLGCFGNFSLSDPVCRKLCALNLRCAIEREKADQMEIIEDMIFSEEMCVTCH